MKERDILFGVQTDAKKYTFRYPLSLKKTPGEIYVQKPYVVSTSNTEHLYLILYAFVQIPRGLIKYINLPLLNLFPLLFLSLTQL